MDKNEIKNYTLAELLAGDRPQMPRSSASKQVRWYDVASLPADRINYNDFSIRKGELMIGVGNSVFIADGNGICLGNALWASAPFRVDMSGNTYMTNAVISGQINATSGVIGGFTVTDTQMYGGIIKTSLNAGAGQNGVIMDSDGLRGYSSTLGNVFNIPTDGSAPTFSSGIINSTVFEINTNAILRTSDTVGDGTADSSGVLINNTGIYGVGANQTLADANIRILSDGTGYFNGYIYGGMTDYMTGAGYFLGLNEGLYKFAVGNPAGNYLNWDGENLYLKGVMELTDAITLASYATADLPVPPTSLAKFPSSYT
jgi:hypothetical protein